MISPTPTQMTDADMEVEIIDYSEQDESAMIPEVEEIEDSKERMDTVEQAEGEAELEMVDVNTGEEEMVEEPMFQDEPILEDINVEALEVVGTLPLSFDSVTTIAEVEPEVSSILELIQPSAEAEIDYSTEEPVEVSTSTVTTLSTKIEPEISQETEIAVAQLELEGNLVNSTIATTTNIKSTLFTAQPPQFEEPLDVKGKGREKVVDLENDDLSTS